MMLLLFEWSVMVRKGETFSVRNTGKWREMIRQTLQSGQKRQDNFGETYWDMARNDQTNITGWSETARHFWRDTLGYGEK